MFAKPKTVHRMLSLRPDTVSRNNATCLCCLYSSGLLPSSSTWEEGCYPFVSVCRGFLSPEKNTQKAVTQEGTWLFSLLCPLKIDQQRKCCRLSAFDVCWTGVHQHMMRNKQNVGSWVQRILAINQSRIWLNRNLNRPSFSSPLISLRSWWRPKQS